MQIGDVSYFAPNIPFEALDVSGDQLPDQILARFEGYYLQPADLCIQTDHAFAAGLLAVACIDAASHFAHGPNRAKRLVGRDFKTYARTRLSSFRKPNDAALLYDEYRNGLVHEPRLKNGCQFSLNIGNTLNTTGKFIVIDAGELLREVRDSIHGLAEEMQNDAAFQAQLVTYVRHISPMSYRA